jgi:hypothetical protein
MMLSAPQAVIDAVNEVVTEVRQQRAADVASKGASSLIGDQRRMSGAQAAGSAASQELEDRYRIEVKYSLQRTEKAKNWLPGLDSNLCVSH